MSLNGLDAAKVTEAYQAALADAGGWFLLKYITRDEVDILSRGGGGVVEIRRAIEQYSEKSPLYGFIQYRRRKVLLKYVPEGTSRLLQARVSVHFQSIIERFTPHDTTFSLTAPADLSETALSSACSLHADSGSLTSSSSSLRRRRLNEITEDAGESGLSIPSEDAAKAEINKREPPTSNPSPAVVEHLSRREPSNTQSNNRDRFVGLSEAHNQPLVPTIERPGTATTLKAEEAHGASNQKQLLDLFAGGNGDRRQSSQSTRPSVRDLDYASAYKPKIKLGPRPSLDMRTRPQTSGSYPRQYEPRPISTLPAGVRASPRKSTSPNQRPKSQGATISSQYQYQAASIQPPIPTLSLQSKEAHSSVFFSPASLAPSSRSIHSSPRSPGITPEKQRLMKALQLRKKQLAIASQEQEKKDREVQAGSEQEAIRNSEMGEEIPEDKRVGDRPASNLDRKDSSPVPERENALQADGYPTMEIEKDDVSSPTRSHVALGTFLDLDSPLHDLSKGVVTADVLEVNLGDPKNTHQPMVSPASLPEISESPSTQGSSFTDEPDHPEQDADETSIQANSVTETETSLIGNKESETQLQQSDLPTSTVSEVTRSDELVPTPLSSATEMASDSPLDSDRTEKGDRRGNESVIDQETEPRTPEPERPSTKASRESETSLPKLFAKKFESSPRPSTAGTDINRIERTVKRLGLVDPIRTISSTDNSDDNLYSDDSFMEELKSAKVQEAKPVSVSKSPINSLFPFTTSDRRPSDASRNSRTVSNPVPITMPEYSGSPRDSTPRSASGGLTAKKVNVSSGISKRIKALEMFSSRDSSPSSGTAPMSTPPSASSPFGAIRNSLARNASKTSSFISSTPRVVRSKTNPSPSSEETVAPKSSQHQMNTSFSTAKTGLTRVMTRPDSISVTARIIRAPSDEKIEAPVDPSRRTSLTMHKSPLTVERDTPEAPRSPFSPIRSIRGKRRLSLASAPESRSETRGIHLLRKSEHELNVSLSARSKTDSNLPRSTTSDASSISSSKMDEYKEEKKESRKSRLIKRMSLITSSSRRSLVSVIGPTKQENLIEGAPIMESAPDPPQVVDIGDVNVQFPDSLLWKRRFMRIDDQGYLVLDPSRIDDSARSITKRYHLSEFRKPFIPDQDREEMPNSILLDFMDGSTLQCACESRRGQSEILHTLVDAHSAYHQLYPN